MVDGWSVAFHESSTGTFLAEAKAVDGSWGTSITAPGSGQHKFRLDDGQYTRDEWRLLTSHWSKTLVHRWDGWPVYAGLVMRRDYDRSSAELTVSHGEVRTIFSRRLPFAVGDPAGAVFNPAGSVTVSGRSFPAAVRQLVRTAATAAGFELPIIYPADASGPYSNEWKYYSFPTVDEMLSDIEKTAGGPDIHFTPQYDGNTLRWVLRVGAPRLTGAPYEWNVTADGSDSLGVSVVEDGSKQLTGVFSIGTGSDEDMKVGGARDAAGPAIPFMDSSRPFKAEADRGKLNAFASAELQTYRKPTLQVGFSAKASLTENLAGVVPGSALSLYWQDDFFMPDGWQSNYLMGMSGSFADTIDFEVQPV